MPHYKVIKLKNLSPLHIGSGKENYDFSATELQSDTISSALAALRAQKGESENIDTFLHSFSISSAFPYWKGHFFLPKMQGKLAITVENEEEYTIRKKLKKIRYIEYNLWSELVAGKKQIITKDQLQGEFLVTDPDFECISTNTICQRVTVARDGRKSTEPFFFEWRFFHPEAGLFFLIDSDEQTFSTIVKLFKELGETGIGTDKNIGGGKFDIEISELSLPDIQDSNSSILLSLYIPTEEEIKKIELSNAKFNITLRDGFIAGSNNESLRHLRKKSIYMLTTGSVLPIVERLEGKIVDLKPNWNDHNLHPVFRSGRPVSLPIKVTDYE
ncbi:MAG: type III-A CRISPR-associated RAMP protein Csm4 [Bacteroides pyogenes]|uniref:type III-A CRISPR-associated RAMP protein Csm4 n=1 Tax=Bacteroides pyogenes TaxID=310300 RepID=UPI00242BDABD|nr:type III-A CRISPR-associated RAMP protein Csm4 [Bacteroides pyogenes]MCI7069916.1 type III-A CRISPR-associated RAMP protein Csm4 [Bacteroides pyogenes]